VKFQELEFTLGLGPFNLSLPACATYSKLR